MPDGARRLAGHWGVRAKLTALTTAMVLVPLLVGIVVVVQYLHQSLGRSLAEQVRGRLEDVGAVVSLGGPTAPGAAHAEHLNEGVVVQVLDAAGVVVYSSQRGGQSAPLVVTRPPVGHDEVTGLSSVALFEETPPRVVGARGVLYRQRHYTVVVAMSQQAQREAVQTVAAVLVGGTPVLLIVGAVLSWWLVGRTLRPVEAIRRGSELITASKLNARVPVAEGRDEITRLAETMNDMLARLESAQRRQRAFVADASHELRSPLANLRTSLELARGADGADLAELLALMDAESRRLTRLVDDLLTLSQADEHGLIRVESRDVDLDDLVAGEALRIASTTALSVRVQVQPVRVSGDVLQLARVVRNLIDNAVRAAVGTVRVSVRRDGSWAELSVEDDGPGIPEPDRQRVFERFIRLGDDRSRASGGSGLGLPIVRELVRSHGGQVTVQDSPLGGARLTVRIPAQPPPQPEPD